MNRSVGALVALACLGGPAGAIVGGDGDAGPLSRAGAMVLSSKGGVCSAVVVARDALLPSIRLTASLGAQGHSLSQLLRDPTELWSIGGSVLAPLFDAGRLRAQARRDALGLT